MSNKLSNIYFISVMLLNLSPGNKQLDEPNLSGNAVNETVLLQSQTRPVNYRG